MTASTTARPMSAPGDHATISSAPEFEPERVDTFLRSSLGGLSGSMQIERVAGGQSNPTFYVTYSNRRLVLRKQPAGEILASAHAATANTGYCGLSRTPIFRCHARFCSTPNAISSARRSTSWNESKVGSFTKDHCRV